ncbi:MAG TPA: RCC1 repeat-containing protein [Planctomycetota bacterium]|nr:RCC1 repeat-containing protein [Planctomycetota bacterium]
MAPRSASGFRSCSGRRALARLAALGLLGLLLPACGISGAGTLTPTAAPGIPANLSAQPGNQSASLQWNPSSAASTYVVLRSTVSGGPYSPVPGGAAVTGTSFKDSGLTNGQAYYYVVGASNAFGQSPVSGEIRLVSGIFAAQVATGITHTLALLTDGSLWGWGDDLNGNLGDGRTSTLSAVAVEVPLTDVSAIAVGNRSSVALCKDGTVWTWGINTAGQLGNGTVSSGSATPVQAGTPSGIVSISAGSDFNLAIRSDGTLWGWGNNTAGQLGVRNTGPSVSTPLQIPGLSNVRAVAAGLFHSLALLSDGTVWAWGTNDEGQLGDGTQTSRIDPVVVTNLTDITALAAGSYHSLALASDGRVWAWGGLFRTPQGAGTATASGTSLPLVVPNLSAVQAIGAGYFYSVALRSDGSLWSWGSNTSGLLGFPGAGTASLLPVEIPLLGQIQALAAGQYDAAAIQAGGLLWGWGDNTYGQLGNGSAGIVPLPIPARDLASLSAIGFGSGAGLALRSDHTLWSWGDGSVGQLGDGGAARATGDRVQVSAPAGLSSPVALAVSAGLDLVLNSDGSVWSWGNDDDYALGHTTTIFNLPEQIPTLSGITGIAAGNQNGFAVGAGGVVWGWGFNGIGNAGTGTSPNDVPTPTPLPGLSGITAVASGVSAGLALGPGGAVWTWGNNADGELGIGTTSGQSGIPVLVPGLSGVVAIAAGNGFDVALKSDGTVWAWGSNATGALGGATAAPNSGTPIQVPGLSSFTSIVAGHDHVLALRSDGTVWAWGGNSAGQLGNGQYTPFGGFAGPAPIQGLDGVLAVAAGDRASAALRTDHSMWGWGSNSVGQLAVGTLGYSPVPVLITK